MNFKKKGLVLSSALMMVSLVLPTTSALAQIQTESANENSKPTDEEYADFISNEIDTLDGEEEKAYNEALKEQEDKKSEDKKSKGKKQVKRILPKTSAVK